MQQKAPLAITLKRSRGAQCNDLFESKYKETELNIGGRSSAAISRLTWVTVKRHQRHQDSETRAAALTDKANLARRIGVPPRTAFARRDSRLTNATADRPPTPWERIRFSHFPHDECSFVEPAFQGQFQVVAKRFHRVLKGPAMEPRRVPFLGKLGPTAAGERAMRDVVAGLGESVPSTAGATGGWFALRRLGSGFWAALVARYERRRTIRTLEALDNRALSDIGVNRGQIPAIAAAAAEGHDGRRGERAEPRPNRWMRYRPAAAEAGPAA